MLHDDTIIIRSLLGYCSVFIAGLLYFDPAFTSLHLVLDTVKTKCVFFNRNPQVQCPFQISSWNGSEADFVKSFKYLSGSDLTVNSQMKPTSTSCGQRYNPAFPSHTLPNSFWLKWPDFQSWIMVFKLDIIYDPICNWTPLRSALPDKLTSSSSSQTNSLLSVYLQNSRFTYCHFLLSTIQITVCVLVTSWTSS